MAYVKYSPEQIAEREKARAAIVAAKAHLKSMRSEKKTKGLYLAEIRRAGKAYLRRRKEVAKSERLLARMAAVIKKEPVSPEVALKKKCRPLLAVLRKVYKPYCVARRKVERLKKLKLKAELEADRKAAKEAIEAAKELIMLRRAQEYLAARGACVLPAELKKPVKKTPKKTPKKTEVPKKPELELKEVDIANTIPRRSPRLIAA